MAISLFIGGYTAAIATAYFATPAHGRKWHGTTCCGAEPPWSRKVHFGRGTIGCGAVPDVIDPKRHPVPMSDVDP
jgi:hypothetical protein